MIKLGENYDCSRDNHGWALRVWHTGKSKKTGEPTRIYRTLYYATLAHVLESVLDLSAGQCESAAELKYLLQSAAENINQATTKALQEQDKTQ